MAFIAWVPLEPVLENEGTIHERTFDRPKHCGGLVVYDCLGEDDAGRMRIVVHSPQETIWAIAADPECEAV